MSSTGIIDPPQDGSGSDRRHPILGFARALDGALDKAAQSEPVFMTTDQKKTAVLELSRQKARLDALFLKVLAAADADDVAGTEGATSTGAWLSHHTHTDRPAAAGTVKLATSLEYDLPTTAAGLAAGEFSMKHARVIAWAINQLPKDLSTADRVAGEASMVAEAPHLSPTQLRILGRHLLEVIPPDEAERRIGEKLAKDEAAAQARARFSMRANGDGTSSGWFKVPDLHAAMLKASLDAIAAPRKHDAADQRDAVTGRRLEHASIMGQAFCELIEHLPTSEFGDHGGVAATLVITTSLDKLTDRLGTATLPDGSPISAGQARRLACNAGILPAVMDGKSAALDLGREARLFDKAQRITLALRDRGCRAETCDRPPAWCEAHHWRKPWAQGGRTDLADGILLCPHHHRLAHSPAYDHRLLPNGDIRYTRRT